MNVDTGKSSPRWIRLGVAGLIVAALGLIVAAGWQALAGLHEVGASVRTVVADRVMPLVQLRAVGDLYQREVADGIYDVLEAGVTAHIAAARLRETREKAESQWQAYLQTNLVPEEKQLVARIEPELAHAHELVREVERLLVAGDVGAVTRLERSSLHAAFASLTDSIDSLVDLQRKLSEEEVAASELADRRTTWRALTALALAFVCATALLALTIYGSARRRAREAHRLRRLNNLYAALSRTNQSIVRVRNEADLLDELCRTCVDTGHAVFAVVMRLSEGRPKVAARQGPSAMVALVDRYMEQVASTIGAPTYQALFGGETRFVQDYAATTTVAPPAWRRETMGAGVQAMASLPIRVHGQAYASLTVFVDERDYFDAQVRDLLVEMADDLGFAIETLRHDEERRQAVAEVEASAQRFLRVFNALPVSATLVDMERYTLLDANRSFCERYALSREQLIGQTLRSIGVQTDDASRTDFYRALQRGESVRNLELAVTAPDGSQRVVLASGEPLEFKGRTAALTVTVDITERLRAERALREREARLAGVVDSAGDAIVTMDSELHAVVFNRAASELFGLAADEVLGRSVIDRISPPDQLTWLTAQAQRLLKDGGKAQADAVTGLRADGSRIQVRVALSSSGEPGRRLVTIVLHDLSTELAALAAGEAQRAAEAANTAKTEFLSRMSHELRTPLNAVLGFSQLLQADCDPPLSPGQALKVGAIRDAGWHLLALINDVLDVSRIETGHLRVDRVDVELARLLDEVMEMMEGAAQVQGVRLEPAYRLRARIVVSADPLRLRQAAVNLISNAIKYNRPQGRVTADLSVEGEYVVLTVQDEGAGMDDAQLKQLFEPFNRLGRERSGIEGTGVGLALTRQLVQLMHGQIEVSSKVGVGTTVRLLLPLAADRASPRAEAGLSRPDELADEAPVRGRVLYVEDSAVNVIIVEQLLKRWPEVELVAADTGAKALELARTLKPDLVLLDMKLGDMDGLEVLDAMRADPTLRNLRVVMLSASAMPESMAEARRRGALDYWTKPIDFALFVRGMRRLLR